LCLGDNEGSNGNLINYFFVLVRILFFILVAEFNKEGEVLFKQHHISTTQALAMTDWLLDVDARVIDAIRVGKERGFVSTGDAVIVVTGWVRHHLCYILFHSFSF
jgi:hypothetical protein